jgi:hypothetical protein
MIASSGSPARDASGPLLSMHVLIAVLLLPSWHAANACQCAGLKSLERARAGSVAVVTGVVAGLHPSVISTARFRPLTDEADQPRWYPVTRIVIDVTRVYKGETKDTLTLTHIGCCVCEKQLEAGKEFLLFVRDHWDIRDAQMVSFCDPTQEVAAAAGDLVKLGPPLAVFARHPHRRRPFELVRDGAERVANLAVRAVLARTRPDSFVQDPLPTLTASPWFGFGIMIGAGGVLALVIIAVRRRARSRRWCRTL